MARQSNLSRAAGHARLNDALADALRRHGYSLDNVHALPAMSSTEYAECPRHGRYPVFWVDADGFPRSPGRGCPKCAKEPSKKLMEQARIPARHKHCGFDNYQADQDRQAEALDACRRYAEAFADNRGENLVLTGNPGTGKTHLAAAIARTALAQGRSVLMTTAYELVLRIRKAWRRDDEDEDEITEAFASADLLIVDEAGKQYGSESESVHLFQVFDRRYRNGKPTILLSNKDLDGIRACLGDPILDRLNEDGCSLVSFDWESHRGGRHL